jgi:hypothetical protein
VESLLAGLLEQTFLLLHLQGSVSNMRTSHSGNGGHIMESHNALQVLCEVHDTDIVKRVPSRVVIEDPNYPGSRHSSQSIAMNSDFLGLTISSRSDQCIHIAKIISQKVAKVVPWKWSLGHWDGCRRG